MAFLVTTQQTVTRAVSLADLRYRDWPSEARGLAKVVLGNPTKHAEFLNQLDRKDWLIAEIEALHARNHSIAEWLGED